jgi:hypothetical protein
MSRPFEIPTNTRIISQRNVWRPFFPSGDNIQNYQSRLLLANYVQRCLFDDQKMHSMSKKFSGKMKREAIPLNPMSIEEPFAQWGLDVIGPINPKSNKGHSYILTATDYFTKWQEVVALKTVDTEQLIMFLKDNILARFGVPEKLITDNGSIFIGSKFTEFCGEHGIIMGKSSNYYPQGNGMVESTNKTLIQVLKKIISENQRNWHKN